MTAPEAAFDAWHGCPGLAGMPSACGSPPAAPVGSSPAAAAAGPGGVLTGRTFAAVVFALQAAAPYGRGVAAVGRRVAVLRACGVEVTVISRDGSVPVGWPAGCPVAPGGAGPEVMRGIVAVLARRGVGPGLLLVVGGEFGAPGGNRGPDGVLLVPEAARAVVVSVGPEPGGVPAGVVHVGGGSRGLLALLDEQVRRHARLRVPAVDEDPEWIVCETGTGPLRRRVIESLFTLGAGGVATRGSVEERAAGAQPMVLAAGVYDGTGPGQHLLPGPVWTALTVEPAPAGDRRVLDLRTGVLERTELTDGCCPVRTLRLASITIPGVVAMRAEAPSARLRRPGRPLRRPAGAAMAAGRVDGMYWARTDTGTRAGIAAVAVQQVRRDGPVRTVQRVAAYAGNGRYRPGLRAAADGLHAAGHAGFGRLLADHRAAWADRWDAVDIQVRGDPQAQLALRFALFQLWSAVTDRGELALGARGLSGPGYSGHVFWDADVFMLPAVAAMDPAAGAAMIRYRLRRLDAARARARAAGLCGARFPWESAASGQDVTPRSGRLAGRRVPILTGQLEEHITADVAWAAAHYASWTGLHAPAVGPLLAETARYWASRCRVDAAGRAHIDAVIGPDEYHERVDDNAFTNVMARWNLRAGADAAGRAGIDPAETRQWRELADRLVDGYDPATSRYEQFAGYFALEPLLITDVAVPPVAADLLLGRDRVARSQVIKQPDVLMAHHLVPDQLAPGSLGPNLDYYDPRTAHGSSLSPAITASLLARAGRPDEALATLRMALELDLDDLTGMTGAGLHMANLGGVWQAVVFGLAGVGVRAGVLNVDPRLPGAWDGLQLRFRCLGRRVRLDITHDRTQICADAPLAVALAGQAPRTVTGTVTFRTAG
jgi:trehalose/maltose hydrolase-like predicted phosphorylase